MSSHLTDLRAGGLLDELPRLAAASTWRSSSWDRSGGNRDWTDVAPGATVTLLDVDGPGVIRHLYWAVIRPAPNQYRQVVLRMYVGILRAHLSLMSPILCATITLR